MGNKTPLYQEHLRLKALMVEFGGWDMPLHYGSQVEEHHQVRASAGMFDVSHMGVVDIEGPAVQDFLRYLLANNIDKLKTTGKALYGCMLNESGGVLDDLITYFVSPIHYRLVVNASTKEKDLKWIKEKAKTFSVTVQALEDYAMIAVQGPQALDKLSVAFPMLKAHLDVLAPFHFIEHEHWFIARTGYTGEAGVEIILPAIEALHTWQTLIQHGVHPCGLGARDTLRLEAGFNLYGQDMDESVTPLESNLSWTLDFQPIDRHFIGRSALEAQQKMGVSSKLVGLILEEKGVLRHHQKIFCYTTDISSRKEVGYLTSGTFAPTLKISIGFARIKMPVFKIEMQIPLQYCVEIRDKPLRVSIVQPPFFRRQK